MQISVNGVRELELEGYERSNAFLFYGSWS